MFGFGTRFRDYIFTDDGRIFCVDTVETFDCGWETMVGEIEDYEAYAKTIQEWIAESEEEELSDSELKEILPYMDFCWDLFDMTNHYRSQNSAYKGHIKTVKKLTKMVKYKG